MTRAHSILRPAALALAPLALLLGMRISPLADPKCDPDNGGLVLPEGFCATVVASQLGPVRQLAVGAERRPLRRLERQAGRQHRRGAGIQGPDGDGKPDERASFGPGGGNDVKLHNGYRLLRAERPGRALPAGRRQARARREGGDGGRRACRARADTRRRASRSVPATRCT